MNCDSSAHSGQARLEPGSVCYKHSDGRIFCPECEALYLRAGRELRGWVNWCADQDRLAISSGLAP